MVFPSRLMPPFFSVGTSVARSGIISPLSSNFTRYEKTSNDHSVDDVPFSSAGLSERGSHCCAIVNEVSSGGAWAVEHADATNTQSMAAAAISCFKRARLAQVEFPRRRGRRDSLLGAWRNR